MDTDERADFLSEISHKLIEYVRGLGGVLQPQSTYGGERLVFSLDEDSFLIVDLSIRNRGAIFGKGN